MKRTDARTPVLAAPPRGSGRRIRRSAAALLGLAFAGAWAGAAPRPADPPPARCAAECAGTAAASSRSELHPVPARPVLSEHSIRLGDDALRYTAEIGRVAIRDAATGEARGYMGYIAYTIPAEGKAVRPLTFVWNGGPGANSSLLHFEVAGPKRGEGERLVDNAETWLAFTDLVFVDPIGTGFSRPAKAEYAQEFYGTVGDVASVTEFVRAWRLLHGSLEAPIFLAGESWGAGRAASVGYALLEQDIPVRGLVLISGGAGLPEPPIPPELRAALKIVDLAPVALHHGKLDGEVGGNAERVRRSAERWARSVYAPALARAEALSERERTRIVTELARYSGLPADRVDRRTLTFTPRQYLEGLLGAEGKTLNTFDMRLTGEPARPFAAAIGSYLRYELGYLTDLPYAGLAGEARGYAPNGNHPQGVGARWNYATADVSPEAMEKAIREAIERGGGPPKLGPPLPATAEAVELAPELRVLVAAGRFDSLASCTVNAEIERNLPPPLGSAMTFRCYEGGHMFYRDAPSRLRFSRDVAALIGGTG